MILRKKETKNQIYFASTSPFPIVGRIDYQIPKDVDKAINKIPEITRQLEPITENELKPEHIFIALQTIGYECELYEDIEDENRQFFLKIAENEQSCLLESLETKKLMVIVKKSDKRFQKI